MPVALIRSRCRQVGRWKVATTRFPAAAQQAQILVRILGVEDGGHAAAAEHEIGPGAQPVASDPRSYAMTPLAMRW
jgi:hypothetical protein